MKYKTDWDEARERLSGLWLGDRMDRPCMSVTAPSGRGTPHPAMPGNPEDKWLDPDWVLANLEASIQNTWWGGEAIPSYLLMGGWTASLGGRPNFDYKTIWFETFDVDFGKPSPFVYAEDDEWRQKHEKLYCAAAALAGRDDFLVGKPSLLPANDLLSMHMGTTAFLIALMDDPEWMAAAILTGAREQLAERNRLQNLIRDKHDFWYGNGGWMPFWAPEPYIPTQSDVSCMLSPEAFEKFVLPELDLCGQEFGAMWYHLDGHDAKQHLPRLLSLPYMRVMQYVPTPSEPPNGPGQLELYKTIQQAGVIVHVSVAKQHAEPLIKALDPSLLMLDIRCDSIEEGEALLSSAKGWIWVMLERDLLTDKAARELISRIFQGIYRVGDRLPPERELATALNVSRGTIRSCIAKLRHMGLLQSKPGSGNYICSPPRGAIPSVHLSGDVFQTTLEEVLVAREAIEIPAFRLALENRSDEDLLELENLVTGMKDQANDLERFLSLDMEFHRRMLMAGGNEALLVAYDAIRDFHRFSQVYTSFGDHEIEVTVRHHERILSALKAGANGKPRPGSARPLQNHFRDMHRYSRESERA